MADEDDNGEQADGHFDDDTYGEFLAEQRETFRHQSSDWLLARYVHLINWLPADVSWGMTVYVGGAVVSGQLISYSRYLRELSAHARSSTGVIGEALFGFLDEIAGEQDAEDAIRDALSEDEAPMIRSTADLPTYLHLREAQVWHGLTPLGGQTHWRFRIGEVSGWTFGEIGGAPSQF